MQRDEVVAVGDVAGEAIAGLTRHIHDVHDGIARRVWRSVGSVSDPVRLTHDRIADGVYRALTISLGGAVRISARAVSLRTAADAPSLEQSPAGRFAVGALNGAFGDALERRGNPLAWPMTLRAGGDEMPATPEALAAAYPRATGKLAVFLHGLCETEGCVEIRRRAPCPLRRAASRRARLHAAVHPLQHRTPHLAERP
jgi:hypothetical protein